MAGKVASFVAKIHCARGQYSMIISGCVTYLQFVDGCPHDGVGGYADVKQRHR